MNTNEYITLSKAAEELHCHKETLLRAKRRKELQTWKPGREIVTTRDALKAWMDARK